MRYEYCPACSPPQEATHLTTHSLTLHTIPRHHLTDTTAHMHSIFPHSCPKTQYVLQVFYPSLLTPTPSLLLCWTYRVVRDRGRRGKEVQDRMTAPTDGQGTRKLRPHPRPQRCHVSKGHHKIQSGHRLSQVMQNTDLAAGLPKHLLDDPVGVVKRKSEGNRKNNGRKYENKQR